MPLRNDWQNRRIGLEGAPGVQLMADAVEKWCKGIYKRNKEGRSLMITGTFGCGKTECLRAARGYVKDIAVAVYPDFWPKPIIFCDVNWSDFIRGQVEDDNREQMEDLISADVIFIDDLGSEEDRFKSGAPTRILGDVLGKIENKFIFITSNISPENGGWLKRWDGRVQDRLLRSGMNVVNLWRPELKVESYAVWKLKQGL